MSVSICAFLFKENKQTKKPTSLLLKSKDNGYKCVILSETVLSQ